MDSDDNILAEFTGTKEIYHNFGVIKGPFFIKLKYTSDRYAGCLIFKDIILHSKDVCGEDTSRCVNCSYETACNILNGCSWDVDTCIGNLNFLY